MSDEKDVAVDLAAELDLVAARFVPVKPDDLKEFEKCVAHNGCIYCQQKSEKKWVRVGCYA